MPPSTPTAWSSRAWAPSPPAWPVSGRSVATSSSPSGWPVAARYWPSASACRCCSRRGRSTACAATAVASGPARSNAWTPRSCPTWAGTRSARPRGRPCSPGSAPAPGSTSCTPTACATPVPPSCGVPRPRSPGPPTVSRSRPRSRTARWPRPSFTRRSPATPAPPSCPTGSKESDDAHLAAGRRRGRRPGRPAGPGRGRHRDRLRRPHGGRAGLAAGRRGLDPPGRPGRRLRPRLQRRPARPGGPPPGPAGRAVRRHPRRRIAGHRPGHRLHPGQPGHGRAGAAGLGPLGDRAAWRPDRRRPGRARHPAGRPRLDLRRRRPVRDPGPAERRRLRPLRGHRRDQGRHPPRPQPGPAARRVRPHRPPGGGQRGSVQPGRPAGHRRAGADRRRQRDRRQGALRGRVQPGGSAEGGLRVTVAVRVIPCLDVDAGRVVKGVNFRDLRDAGDPVELAATYDAEGADELTFLDITASSGSRETTYEVVRRTAAQVFIPLTVGGGVRSAGDVDRLLRAGADKVSLNTAAIARPDLLAEAAERFGSQCVVLSVDARRYTGPDPETSQNGTGPAPPPSGFEVTTHGGRRGTGIDAVDWARRGAELGAGEILLNSMDADGTEAGFDLELITAAPDVVTVPVIASGGAGQVGHFAPAIAAGADAVLAASVFHFGALRISQVKDALRAAGRPVR